MYNNNKEYIRRNFNTTSAPDRERFTRNSFISMLNTAFGKI